MSPSVVVADPARELRWRGALPLGLFTGEHAYLITPAESGTRVVHRGWYRGLLVRIFGSVIDRTGRGFEHMHRALKERAEELSPPVIAALPMLGSTELGIRGFEAHGSTLLTEAARVVASVLGVERVGVLGLARDGETLVLRAGVGWPPGGVGRVRATAGDGTPAGYALLHAEPLVTRDVAADPRLRTLGAAETAGIIGGMAVRIQDGGRPLGVLDAWTRTPREFASAEVAFVEAVAGVLAPALAVGASEARGSAAVAALLAAAEAERVRVATELHDDTLQTLTAMRLTIDRLAAAWQRGDEAAAEQAVEGAPPDGERCNRADAPAGLRDRAPAPGRGGRERRPARAPRGVGDDGRRHEPTSSRPGTPTAASSSATGRSRSSCATPATMPTPAASASRCTSSSASWRARWPTTAWAST